MSLWRKRNNVHHNEQKHDNLVNILPNLSIQSDDLSIKREKAMREVQPWVGLTPSEIDEIIEDAIDPMDALLQTMDKLKEKNT